MRRTVEVTRGCERDAVFVFNAHGGCEASHRLVRAWPCTINPGTLTHGHMCLTDVLGNISHGHGHGHGGSHGGCARVWHGAHGRGRLHACRQRHDIPRLAAPGAAAKQSESHSHANSSTSIQRQALSSSNKHRAFRQHQAPPVLWQHQALSSSTKHCLSLGNASARLSRCAGHGALVQQRRASPASSAQSAPAACSPSPAPRGTLQQAPRCPAHTHAHAHSQQ